MEYFASLSISYIKLTLIHDFVPFPAPYYNRINLSISVLGLDKVGKGLGLLELRGVMVVVVVILGADVFHFVDTAALGASLNGTLLGELHNSNS